MSYVKDSPPIRSELPTRQAHLDRELEKIRSTFEIEIARLDQIYEVLQAGGITTLYFWDDSVVMADPGTGNMRGDDIQLTSVTQFAIHKVTLTGSEAPFGRLDSNSRMMVRNESSGVEALFSLDSTPVDNATWWLFNVTFISGAVNNPVNGAIMSVMWFPVIE